jgi:hypothetical protein
MEKMALALVVLMCGFAAVLVIFGCFLTYYACWNYFHKKHRKRYQQQQMEKDIDDPAAGAESNKLFCDDEKKKKKRSVYVYFTASGLREKVENDETIELNAV